MRWSASMQLRPQHISSLAINSFTQMKGWHSPYFCPAKLCNCKEVAQISLTPGEPSQVTAPWGCCHALRTRWRGHSECWQFLGNSTCCLQSQPRIRLLAEAKLTVMRPAWFSQVPRTVSAACAGAGGLQCSWPASFPAFPSPPVPWDILHTDCSCYLLLCWQWASEGVCSLRPILYMSRRIFGKIKHLNYVSAAWLFLKAVSGLSVIFLQKTFTRWLYMAVVLVRAKWRPHAGAP